MKTYVMKKVDSMPDWEKVPALALEEVLGPKNDNVRAQAQICWGTEALYVRLWAKETDLCIEQTGLLADVCLDSCLEFFFRPTERIEYFNFEFNPKCVMYLGFGNGGNAATELIRLLPRNAEELFIPKSDITQEGWEVRFRVPYAFIRRFFPEFAPEQGKKMYANLYKCGNKARNPHELAWCPLSPGQGSFHAPEDFGCLVFGDE